MNVAKVFKHSPAIFNNDATLTSAILDRILHEPFLRSAASWPAPVRNSAHFQIG